ncbi:MAG: hypothetical protein Q4E47_00975 [Candidatus Saccharibacteria bacterium]|nr:hypothetical protein [Candidatus Saccharibacteria bacterium]
MTSSSKVLKIVDDPLVSQTVLEVIKEIDRQDVVSPNIYQSQLEAAKILVGDWVLGWGNDEDAMERFEDLFDVTETEIERAEDEAYEETADDPEPFQVAIRIAHNWLEAAQEKNGSCVDEFVVLVYKLSMSSISAPLRRRKMVKKYVQKSCF